MRTGNPTMFRVMAVVVLVAAAGTSPQGVRDATGAELKKLEVQKPKKMELKKDAPKLEKAAPKKLKKITPTRQPEKLDKKIAKPSTNGAKKLDIKASGGSIGKKQPRKPGLKGALRKELVEPSSKSLAKDLKPIKKLPLKKPVAGPIKAEKPADGIADTNEAAALQIDPGSGFSKKDLVTPDMKKLVIKPRIKEGRGRDLDVSLRNGGLDRLAGIETGDKSSLGDGAGLDQWRSSSVDHPVDRYAGLNTGRVTRIDRGTVLQGDGPITAFWTSPHGKEYTIIVAPEGTTDEEFNEASGNVDDNAGEMVGLPVPQSTWNRVQNELQNDDGDGSDALDAELLHSWLTHAKSDEEAEADSSAGTGSTQTTGSADQSNSDQDAVLVSDTTDEDGNRTMTFAPADEEVDDSGDGSASDDNGSDSADASTDNTGDDSEDVAEPSDDSQDDTGCADGDENCSGETGISMGGDEQENAPPPPGSCGENGENCPGSDPSNQGGDNGTVRTAGDEGEGGPLNGDTDTAPADGTLRLANEEPVGGELARGDGVLQGAADGTLRLPEGADGEDGGTPQTTGNVGGSPVGDPGVVADDIGSAGQLNTENVQIQSGELNVEDQSLGNLGGQLDQ